MITENIRKEIAALIRREVVPAIGCTEPVAVALCTARATELLGTTPDKITLRLSANMLKNAMGVGIPGTGGMIGLPIAIALGALVGKSEYQLEVLRDVTPQAVQRGKAYIDEKRIKVELHPDAPSKLYIDVAVSAGNDSARAIIARAHTNLVYLEKNGNIELDNPDRADKLEQSNDCHLSLATVWEYATTSPIRELEYMKEARRLNHEASQAALKGNYGHSLGATINSCGEKYLGDSIIEHMLSRTSAACDARMAGAPIPVMSNSGSGNQGITATMPVVSFAEDIHASEEQTLRALTLSHLTSIYIKQSLGRLSALCGCVVASTGASVGLVYLMGGGYNEACSAVKDMVANLTGMICDGAKPSCSMKISSAVSTAMLSSMLAMNGKCVTAAEGIVAEDVDQTIHNLTSIGREAMTETDRLVLKIMTSK